MRRSLLRAILAGCFLAAAVESGAACTNTGSFERWLSEFKAEARAKGISPRAIAALDGVTLDQGIIRRDHGQSVFSQSFLEFSDRMANKNRIATGRSRIAKDKALFDKIERQFGVPASVIVAFWGLETDFGHDSGHLPTLTSLVTLAYDCRRPEKFRAELLDALRIIQKGDLRSDEMRGSWAGEIGQTQFVPSIYLKYALDYEGDGKADLINNVPDVLASTANYLSGLGWRRGEPWLKEVRVPESMDWAEADLTIEHTVGEWESKGVQIADGSKVPGSLTAALLLPMGKNGPAFLVFQNFKVFLEWNQSLIYSTTVAYLATRIEGAPAVSRGHAVPYGYEPTKELQVLLRGRGFYSGDVDGKLGLATRESVKKAQQKFGLPADSYPSPELIARLQSR
ncbi:MAG: lytic murein transglycosylase [Rhodomicrobium sp.]